MMMKSEDHLDPKGTRVFMPGDCGREAPEDVIARVYDALKDQGYDAAEQITGFLLSGDPTYITEHGGARALVQRIERDRLLQSLVSHFVTWRLEADEGDG